MGILISPGSYSNRYSGGISKARKVVTPPTPSAAPILEPLESPEPEPIAKKKKEKNA